MVGIMVRMMVRMIIVTVAFMAASLAVVLDMHVLEAQLLREGRAVAFSNQLAEARGSVVGFQCLFQFLPRRMPQLGITANGLQ